MKVHFEELDQADDRAIARIIRDNLENYHLDIPGTAYYDPELDHLSTYYRKDNGKRAYFILKDEDGKVLGGVGMADFPPVPTCAELQKLYLSDTVKGLGLGYKLMEKIESEAVKRGYTAMYLETHSNLEAAMHLYERAGYELIDRPESVVHTTMDRFYYKQLV